MAIYHFSGTLISRSKGRSAIACAAYRAAARLHDEYYGKTHDYTQKDDVVHTEILLPEGAPSWMRDREKLWNAVEFTENRKDAQLAREFTIALPRELTVEQNMALVREFVQAVFVNQGMVADVCFHHHLMSNGERQPHVHVMLTLREVTAQGFGQKVRSWNAKANLLVWREAWAETANRHLALHGHDLRIDHRTLAAQGIDLEPQYKIGASAVKERLARLADHQRIARENGEKLLKHPEIALEALTQQQSTFTHQDIARFVNRHTEDASQFEVVYAKVKGCKEIVALGLDSERRERFTTKAMLHLEQTMMVCAEGLSERLGHGIGSASTAISTVSRSLTDEQQFAFDHLVGGGDLRCVVGYAGSGKSYLLGAAREAWEAQGYRVLGTTLSGIASENLTESSGIESRTLASRLCYWEKGEQLLRSQDILVIDEAGMIGSRQMAQVLAQAEQGGAKVVLVGDPEQLQAISAGAAFRAISERAGYVELTDIRRQREDWQKEATRELATGQIETALIRYDEQHHLHVFETQAVAQKALVEQWNAARVSHHEQSQIILTYLRKEVQVLNDLARQCRREQGELGVDRIVKTERGDRLFAEQDRLYFLKNDRSLGVMNGSLGTIIGMQGTQLHVRLDSDERQPNSSSREIWVDTQRYAHLDHGYAATIHKAQGVTVDRCYVLASAHLDRHATYVALSRHRAQVDLFYSREQFMQKDDLLKTLSRKQSKDVSVDYPIGESFASVRGIDARVLDRHDALSIRVPRAISAFSFDQDNAKFQAERAAQQTTELQRFKAAFETKYPEKAQRLQTEIKDSELTLETFLTRYVEMELEQTRLVNALHASYGTGDSALRKACSEKAQNHSKQLAQFAIQAMKQPDIHRLVEQLKNEKAPHLADVGGFKGIAERVRQGRFSPEDTSVLVKQIQQKAREHALSRDQSRDRGGGRSR